MKHNALLWELSHNDVSHKSFIFGTIHLYKDEYQIFLNELESLMPKVLKVYTETSLDGTHHNRQADYVPSVHLKHELGVKKWEKASRILKKACNVNLSEYERVMPMIIVQMISLKMLGLDRMPSIDALIYQIAARYEKEYAGIETNEEQIKIMSEIHMRYQVASFQSMVKNIGAFRKKMKKLVQLYEDQQIHRLYKSSLKDMGQLRNILLYNRNNLMAGRITKGHFEMPTLFTFGAGHLSGNKGVLALLKRMNYKLRPVSIKNN